MKAQTQAEHENQSQQELAFSPCYSSRLPTQMAGARIDSS